LSFAAQETLTRALATAQQLLSGAEGAVLGESIQGAPRQVGWRRPFILGQSFGADLLLRAFVSRQAIGALETREAVYPRCETDATGEPLHGAHGYTLRFAPGQLPPVAAFWSITLYRSSDYFLVPNQIDRYAIGDRTPGLIYDADGGLTLTIQRLPPLGTTARANWLPAPDDGFFLCLRAYLPQPSLLDGSYQLPEAMRASL
jgi:hypothetical protein